MPKDAIQTDAEEVVDVPENTIGETTDIVVDKPAELNIDEKVDREVIMDQIVQRSIDAREEEMLKDTPEVGDVVEDPPDEAAVEDEVTPPKEEIVEPKVKVKVDGVESEVTADEIRNYQIGKAADKRLADANAQAQRIVQDAQAQADQIAEAARVETPAAEKVDLKDAAGKLTQAIFQEDEEAVAKILEGITQQSAPVAAPMPQAVTQEYISKAVAASLKQEETLKAIDRFKTEYKELYSDDSLKAAVNSQSIVEREKDPSADDWTLLKRSAEHVKRVAAEAFGIIPPKDEKDVVIPGNAERKEKKRKTVVPIRPAVKAANRDPDGRFKPKLSAFEQIQKSRGQG